MTEERCFTEKAYIERAQLKIRECFGEGTESGIRNHFRVKTEGPECRI